MPDSPDSFELNNQPRAADAVPQIPTSDSEVAVRTMASDFELMGQSGGMVNQSALQGVQVPVALHPEATPQPAQSSGMGRGKIILITVAVVIVMGGLFALGYFVIGK